MKSVQSALTSVALSIVASILASWLLRRLLYQAQQGEANTSGKPAPSPVMVVPVVIIGNHLGPKVIVPRRGVALPILGGQRKHH
jgi:hypothetical protein